MMLNWVIRLVGPWTVDMFHMFYLERPNLLTLGDLGVQKGITQFFLSCCKGSLLKGQRCPRMTCTASESYWLELYKPYQSLLIYYMWRAAAIPPTMGEIGSGDNGWQLHRY